MPPCRSECRGGALAPNDRDNIRVPRLALASRWPLRRQPAISLFSRSGRISRVDVQLHADLSARGANLAAHRLKLRSRLRDVYVLRPHPWALDVTRNAGACDAPRKRLLAIQPMCRMRTFAEHLLRGDRARRNPRNSTIISLSRARARVGGSLVNICQPTGAG